MLEDGEEADALLAEHRLERLGLRIVLDKGFAEGTYCVYVAFDELAARVSFAGARKLAVDYCALLKRQLSRSPSYVLGETEDASRSGDPRRRWDLETTFLTIPITAMDGFYNDIVMREQFQLAFLRTNQEWDQTQARARTERLRSREEQFRDRLARLLGSNAYAGLDPDIIAQLLDDVPPLAFPVREAGR